jgi:predicted nuclease of predicted toxin-antitoxin system
MKILADENCGRSFLSALTQAGHEVSLIDDIAPGLDDEAIFAMAREQGLVLLTHDRDFGNIAEHAATRPPGVVAAATRAAIVVKALAELGDGLAGSFVVIEPMGIRTRRYED